MSGPADIIANTIRGHMREPRRAVDAANDAINRLARAGYSIVRRRDAGAATVDRGPPRKPLMTNAIAGEPKRRGVFAE